MLREDDIQQFDQDGVLIVRNVFKPAEVERMQAAWTEARQLLHHGDDGQLRRVDRFIFGSLPIGIRELYQTAALVQMVQQLLGSTDIALYMSRMLVKDRHWNEGVENHQDLPAFHGSPDKISAFVPLQAHNEATGGLKVVKGSHFYGNLGILGTIHLEQFPPMEILTPALEVGDVMFLNFLTWHYSEPATVETDRPLLQIAYQHSSDGAYYELDAPTLVSGQWQTRYFTRHGYGLTKNVLQPGEGHIVYELNAQLEQSVADRLQLESQLTQSRAELNRALSRIQAMETSKFWQARSTWMRLKKTLGLAK